MFFLDIAFFFPRGTAVSSNALAFKPRQRGFLTAALLAGLRVTRVNIPNLSLFFFPARRQKLRPPLMRAGKKNFSPIVRERRKINLARDIVLP